MRTHLIVAVALACVLPTFSCSSSGDMEGECNERFRYDSDIYGPAIGLQIPSRGEYLGSAPAVDCEGRSAPELGDVDLYEVEGQDPSELVFLVSEYGAAVYMNESIPWRDRPQLVKESERYVTCSGPARFTGIWRYVEPEDMPSMEDYDSAEVPYTGNFTTRQGVGVGLERWEEVTLQAEITSETNPLPTPEFLRRATSKDTPVTVTTTCLGESFQIDTMRFAP